jgi:hypothetical protein
VLLVVLLVLVLELALKTLKTRLTLSWAVAMVGMRVHALGMSRAWKA